MRLSGIAEGGAGAIGSGVADEAAVLEQHALGRGMDLARQLVESRLAIASVGKPMMASKSGLPAPRLSAPPPVAIWLGVRPTAAKDFACTTSR